MVSALLVSLCELYQRPLYISQIRALDDFEKYAVIIIIKECVLLRMVFQNIYSRSIKFRSTFTISDVT